jgi:hypothetical protein
MTRGQKIIGAIMLAVVAIAGIRKLSQAQPPGSTKYTLIINSGAGGTTDPAPGSYLYDSGAQATITAIPDSGYQFAGWSGSITGTVNPLAVTMNSDKTIQANFDVAYSNITMTGIVKDSTTGAPITGATVSMMGLAEFTSITDADGRFTITGYTEQVAYLHVSAPDYGDKNVSVINLTDGETRDVGVITLDPIELSHLIMPYGCWILDGNTQYVGGYTEQIEIGFAFKNTGTGQGNGGATFGIKVFKADGSLFYSWSGPCPSVQPGQTAGTYAAVHIGQPGTYTVKTYFNGALVNTLTLTVLLAPLSMAWAPKPAATLTLGQTLTAGVNVHNPSPVRVLFTIKLRSQWYADDGSAPSVVLVTLYNQVIQAGATLNFSGSFVPQRISGPVGNYIPYTHVDLNWGGYGGGEASMYAYTNVV